MSPEEFKRRLQKHVGGFAKAVSTDDGDWIVKGFIDVFENIYTISVDTKVVSKVLELLLFPELARFAMENGLKLILAEHQNHYPDICFVAPGGEHFAVDLKSTYRKSDGQVNGMTLGAFTGYFRERDSNKNVIVPYNRFAAHFVLGAIYSRSSEAVDEKRCYALRDLKAIKSVVRDFEFFVQDKYRIATDRPGSGNTKNIGSVTGIEQLRDGTGPFAEHGLSVFDDYWRHYLTKDMARAAELERPPYTNLEGYVAYKRLPQ